MAKIVSPVWSIIRGSIAGTTYLTTSSGMIIGRQRTMPVNPRTGFQTRIRDGLAKAVTEWHDLTTLNRDQWNAWAVADPQYSTGRQAFIAGQSFYNYVENLGVLPLGATKYLYMPEFAGHPSITAIDIAPSVSPGVAWDVTNNSPQDVMILMELSPMFEETRNFWNGPWDLSQGHKIALLTASGGHTTLEWTTAIVLNKKYFVRIRGISADVTAGSRGNVTTNIEILSQIST